MITQKPEYASFTIPDSPPVLGARTYAIAESAANGFSIGTPLLATDANPEDTLTYTILSGNESGVFALSPSGQLSIADNTTLDFETTPQYSLVVQVGDGNGNFDTADITIIVGDVFEAVAPIVADATRFVVETDPNGTAIGLPITATDSNIGETLSFSIQSGNTDNIFAIDSVSGQITVADNTLMDFGVTEQYLLVIAVFDGILTGTGTVTMNVTDVYIPVAPVIDPTFTRSISEASANGALVGLPVAGIDPNIEDTLTYAITSGNTNGVFTIDNTGQITVLSNIFLDFETTPQYVLGVFVTDNTGRADSTTVTITVTDFYEPIQPVISSAVFAILEGTDNGTNFGSPMVATDANPEDTLTYSITSGNASGIFAIDANSGQLSVVNNTNLSFETASVHSLTVRVDDGTLFNTAIATINITNAAPTLIPSIMNVSEAAANGTSVGTVVATDPGGAPFLFSIIGGNTDNIFAIGLSSGLITVNDNSLLNYATEVQHLLNIQVLDGSQDSNLFDTAIITVNVNNVAPTINAAVFAVNEAAPTNTLVGQLVTTGDPTSYSITSGNTNTAFAVTGTGEIRTSGAIDYETLSQYVLNVQVSDGVSPANANITINVTNVAPVINDATFSINENVTVGTSVGTLPPTEAGLTYSIVSGNSTSAFSINNSGVITVNNTSINYETLSSYSLGIQVSDGFLIDTAVVTINVTNLGPSIANGTFSIFETASNGLSVGTMVGSDPSGGPITYSILSGNANGVFAISNTGVITVVNSTSINYETTSSYSLGIRVSDGLLTADATATINVTNVAPSVSNLIVSVNENAGNGTSLGTMNGSDPKGGSLAYSILSGNASGIFAVSNSGVVTIASNTNLNYETTAQHILSILVSDGALTDTATLTINVNNIGPSITPSGGFVVAESAAIGYVVGTILASDPNGGTLTYSIIAGNTGTAFAISNTGAISVNNNSINYETLNIYSLTVQVSDGFLTNASNYDIYVSNEPPVVSDQTFSVSEAASVGTLVGTIIAADVHGATLSYSMIAGNPDNIFSINNSSGQITVFNTTNLDAGRSTQYLLTIQVSDGFATSTATTTINIIDVVLTQNSGTFNVNHAQAEGSWVGNVIATGGPNLTYSIFGSVPSGNYFTINSSGSIYTTSTPVDVALNGGIITLSVSVSDGLNTLTVNHTVNIIAPVISILNETYEEYGITEDSPAGIFICQIVDTGISPTYSILSGNAGGQFQINSSTGEITTGNTPTNYPTNHTLEVQASDYGNTDTYTLIVQVYRRYSNTTLTYSVSNPNVFSTPDGDQYGSSVDIQADKFMVGTPNEDQTSYLNSGKVMIYSTTTAQHLTNLSGPNSWGTPANDYFGFQICMGPTFYAVAAWGEENLKGRIFIYRTSTNSLLYTITPPDKGDFGRYKMESSGQFLIVSCPNFGLYSGTSAAEGRVFTYRWSNGSLFKTIYNPVTASGTVNAFFGRSVAMSGYFAAVGMRKSLTPLFIFNTLTDTLMHTIVPPASYVWTYGLSFGMKGLSMQDNYLAVGCPYVNQGGITRNGMVYVYDVQTGQLKLEITNPNPATNSDFGHDVAISEGQLLVSAPLYAGVGAVYVFNISTGALISSIIGTITNAYFGEQVNITDNKLIIGARLADSQSGRAYVHTLT